MDKSSNLQIVQQLYQCYAAGNMQGMMAFFDPAVVWLEPGAPDIPFAGTFNGLAALGQMFALEAKNIQVKSFVPKSFCASGDLVVVQGNDNTKVIPTGKTYSTAWVQAFTFQNSKIIQVQVYMDTHAIALAFQP